MTDFHLTASISNLTPSSTLRNVQTPRKGKANTILGSIGSCGSYLDGGANAPFQEAAVPMLEPSLVQREMVALQRHFRDKRDYVVRRLRDMGFVIKYVPDSTFYLWLNLEGLPGPISDGLNFFQACLEEKVIVVPGIFFDLNPARRRCGGSRVVLRRRGAISAAIAQRRGCVGYAGCAGPRYMGRAGVNGGSDGGGGDGGR